MNNPWFDFLATNGGIIEDYYVDAFADKDQELAFAAKQTFICDLSHLDLLAVTGDDAESFLLGQFSNDLRLLDENGSSQLTTYCNPKGRMLALFCAIKMPDGYLLQADHGIGINVLPRLKMYVMRSKVAISDDNEHVQIGIHGAAAATVLLQHFGISIPEQPGSGTIIANTIIIRHPTDTPCFEIIATSGDMQSIWNALAKDCTPVGRHAWDWAQIRAGIPSLAPETVEAFIPQMLNLDVLNAINFKKGCYPGQEIIARMKYLGKLKQRMYLGHLDLERPPRPGTAIFAASFGDQSAGTIVAAEKSPLGGVDLLVVAQISATTGDTLWIKEPAETEIALLPMPYEIPISGETISK